MGRRTSRTTTMATCCGLRGTCRPGRGSVSQATPERTSQDGSRRREPRPGATRRTARQPAAAQSRAARPVRARSTAARAGTAGRAGTAARAGTAGQLTEARSGTESQRLAAGIGYQTGDGFRRALTPCTGRRRQGRRAEREARDRDPARIRRAAAGAGRLGRRHPAGILRAPTGARRPLEEFLVLPVPLGLLSSSGLAGPVGRLGLWGLGLWGLGLWGLAALREALDWRAARGRRAPMRGEAGGAWGPRRQLGTAMVPVLPRRAGPRDR